MGVLTGVDEPALEMAAEHYEVAIRAAHQLHDEELTVEGRDGLKKNPLTQILRDNSTALRGWLTEFGMTPASRSKLQTTPEEQPSLVDELFRMAVERTQTSDEESLREMRDG